MTHPLRRAGTALVALLAGLFTLLASAPAASAVAPPDADTVVQTWKSGDPPLVPGGAALSSSQQSEIRAALEESKAKIYMVALPDGTLPNNQTAGPYLTQLYQTVAQAGRPNATIFVLDGTTVFAGSGALREGVA